MKKVEWKSNTTEQRVNDFYSHGVENFGDFHKGYLNFGLWEDGQTDYIKAAENLIQTLGELLDLNNNVELLDCACGMGAQDVYLHENFSIKKITCLDLVFEHLKFANKRAQNANLLDKMEFIHGTATELPFEDESFHRALCVEGLVHFNTRHDYFREAFRVLKDDGILVVSDYCLKNTPKRPWEKLLLELTLKIWNIPKENADSIETYRNKLLEIGFKKVSVDAIGNKVIPGYFREQTSKECIEELTRIRGFFAGRIGNVIDYAVYWCHKLGLIDYIIVKAEK